MDVKDLTRRVARHFYDLVDENANPLVVALALQDNSSVGLQRHTNEFYDLHQEIRDFLRTRVDESYEGFMESAGVYRYVVEALRTSNEGLQTSKSQLVEVHKQLQDRKPELRDLHKKSIRFKRKLEILSNLEMLQQLPANYEACIVKKEFTKAQQMLENVLEIFNGRNLLNHPSIRPLIVYVQTQQVQLVSQLTEELRNSIYSEGHGSQKRLDYSKTLLTENSDYVDFMKNLPVLLEVKPSNPDQNSFAYVGYIMQTLAGLGGLADSLDTLSRRLQHDLKHLVQVTTQQVIKDLKLTPDVIERVKRGQTLLGQFKLIDQNALSILAKALFAKLAKVLESQRVVTEVAHILGIAYDFDVICDAVLKTVRDFLLEYIGGNSAPARLKSKDPQVSAASDTASKFSRTAYGKGPLFEFGPGDEDSKTLRDFEALRGSLKKSVPGLLADDPHHLFAETGEKEKLSVVAPAHILNIRPLLEPTAALLAKAGGLIKSENNRKVYDHFLDEFIQQSFVPKLQESFEEAIVGISEDENSLDRMSEYRLKSQLPILNCTSQFAETIGLLSQILDTGTGFRADYADMLVGLIESIANFFQTQVTNIFDQSATLNQQAYRSAFKLSAFVSQPALKEALQNRFKGLPDTNIEFGAYLSKRFGSNKPSKTVVSIQDLLDIHMFKDAALLITSMRWFILRLQKMRRVDTVDPQSKKDEDISVRVRRRWTLLDASANLSSTTDISLLDSKAVLGGRSLENFDAVIKKLENCAESALGYLRADIFLRIVYYFDQMVINRDYHSTNRGEERDPVVDRLQHELSIESQIFEEHLLASDCSFLLDDIAGFMAQLFILEGENIKDMNESGQNQILTNIFALQQMLTSIVSDPREVDFSRSTSFYELFRLNPTLIIEKARDGETDLDYQDLKLLLEIRHRNASGNANTHAFGTLSEHMAQLDSIFSKNKPNTPSSRPLKTPTSVQNRDSSYGGQSSPASISSSALRSSRTAATPSRAGNSPEETTRRNREEQLLFNQREQQEKVKKQREREETVQKQQEREELAKRQQKKEELARKEHKKELAKKQHEKELAIQEKQKEDVANMQREELIRAERERQIEIEQNQREHDARNAAQADELRRAREELKANSQSPSATPYITGDAQDQIQTSAQPTAAPAPKAPLFNHRARPVDTGKNASASSVASQSKAVHHLPPRPDEWAHTAAQAASSSPTSSDSVHPLRQKRSVQSISKVRVNTSLASSTSKSPLHSPVTPDQPTSQPRVRTPSERALEASRSVRVRPLPQPQPRKPSR